MSSLQIVAQVIAHTEQVLTTLQVIIVQVKDGQTERRARSLLIPERVPYQIIVPLANLTMNLTYQLPARGNFIDIN